MRSLTEVGELVLFTKAVIIYALLSVCTAWQCVMIIINVSDD